MSTQHDAAGPRGTGGRNRWFAVGTAAFVILLHIAGFGPSMISETGRHGPPSTLVLGHAVVACAWLAFFFGQTLLIATHRTATHRRIGVVAPFLTLAMIALVVPTVTTQAARGYDLSGDIDRLLFAPGTSPELEERVRMLTAGTLAPLLGTFNFAGVVAAGLWYRRRPDIHGRLMLLALLLLTTTPLIHLGGYTVGHWPSLHGVINMAVTFFSNALLFAVAGRDWLIHKRAHPVSLWVPVAVIVETALVMSVFAPTSTWQRTAAWLVGQGQH